MNNERWDPFIVHPSSFIVWRNRDPRTNHRTTDRNAAQPRAGAFRPSRRQSHSAGAAAAVHGRSGHAARSRAGEGAQAQAAGDRRDHRQRDRLAAARGVRFGRGRRLSQFPPRSRRIHGRAHPHGHGAASAGGRARHRRAHEHQPEQGRSHRTSAQRHSRGRAGALPEMARLPRRDAELHRRHRRAGRRRRRRIRAPRVEDGRRRSEDDRRPRRRGSTTPAGTSTRG